MIVTKIKKVKQKGNIVSIKYRIGCVECMEIFGIHALYNSFSMTQEEVDNWKQSKRKIKARLQSMWKDRAIDISA